MKKKLKKDLRILKKWWSKWLLSALIYVLIWLFIGSDEFYNDFVYDESNRFFYSLYRSVGWSIFFTVVFFIGLYLFTAWLFGDEEKYPEESPIKNVEKVNFNKPKIEVEATKKESAPSVVHLSNSKHTSETKVWRYQLFAISVFGLLIFAVIVLWNQNIQIGNLREELESYQKPSWLPSQDAQRSDSVDEYGVPILNVNEIFLKALYDSYNLSGKGTFEEFKRDMLDSKVQERFYNKYLKDLGTFQEFRRAIYSK
jgi:hypothetical protein